MVPFWIVVTGIHSVTILRLVWFDDEVGTQASKLNFAHAHSIEDLIVCCTV